ncbi:MAG TPA: Crp/Fnr family transcriptional regulator [Patescibacteria group bacterium]
MDKLTEFYSAYRQLSLPAKSILLAPTEKVSDIFFLEKGYVRMYLIEESGIELTLHIYRPGTYLPLMLVLNNKKNSYYFESITDVSFRKAPTEKILEFIKDKPEILYNFTKRLAAGLNGYLIKTEILLLHDAYKKIVSLLAYLSEHFGEKQEGGIAINMEITHYFISTMLGITRETVSRQMRKLEKQGVIQTGDQRLVILKPDIIQVIF